MAGSKEAAAYWLPKRTVVITDKTWGDNGKGKIEDEGSEYAKIVMRYNGGPNAGHTVYPDEKPSGGQPYEGRKFVFHGIPSGILHPETICVLGSTVVVNPFSLSDEISNLRRQGVEVTPDNLLISKGAHLIMPWHRKRDALSEKARGGSKIGTTGQGIGPTYSDRTLRDGLRVGDILDPQFEDYFKKELEFQEGLTRVMDREPLLSDLERNPEYRTLNLQQIRELAKQYARNEYYNPEAILEQYRKAKDILGPMITNVLPVIWKAHQKGENIHGEAGQGGLLDLDWMYPYVTSSHPGITGFTNATAIHQQDVERILGVTKVYSTRVGDGPMPTEFTDEEYEISQHVFIQGEEIGATSGRERRRGWFDAVANRLGGRIIGANSAAVTKIDILDGLPYVKIAVGYEVDGQQYRDIDDPDPRFMYKAKPIYETLPGWENSADAEVFDELPENAKRYVRRIEEELGVPVEIVGNGPYRGSTIYR